MKALRALIVEDSEDDALLTLQELESAGFSIASSRVDTPAALTAVLAESEWDIVLSDYSMPQFTALDALRLVQSSRQPDLPFVVVSGSIGEASAVAALKAGISNYVMKDNIAQLAPVVERELKDAQVRRERKEAFAALEQAVAARDEFLSIASHELKTPLTALRLQTQSLSLAARSPRGPLLENADVLRALDRIERSAERLTQLIDRLLDISRVRSGHLALSREVIDLVGVVRESVAQHGEQLADAGCEVAIRAPDELRGNWDPDRIAIVVGNLLSNAAKYGARKPIAVELEDAGDRVLLRVTDRGIGISADDRERIFGRFERAVPEKHYGGFGVGLWLARVIVEEHGGTIGVVSSPGEGSTFTVSLPKGEH